MTIYQAPSILTRVRAIVDFPRETRSTDFAAFVADPGAPAHDSYRQGLVGLICILCGFIFVWACVLVMLKLRGKAMGCAAGYMFGSVQKGRVPLKGKLDKPANAGPGSTDSDEFSTSSEEDKALDVTQKAMQNRDEEHGQVERAHACDISSISSVIDGASSIETGPGLSMEECSVDDGGNKLCGPSRRENRTRAVFFFFAMITFAAIPLVLIYAFSPLNAATTAADNFALQTREIVAEVDAALGTVTRAVNSSMYILDTTPLNFSEICPAIQPDQASEILGVDLEGMLRTVRTDYKDMRQGIEQNITEIENVLLSIRDGLGTVETSSAYVQQYMWVVPGLLLFVCSVTASATVGVGMAWRRDSNKRYQKYLTYIVLPSLICISLACWVIAVAAATVAAVTSDSCTQGTKHGTPDQTVLAILKGQNYTTDGSVYRYAQSFLGNCTNGEEMSVLSTLEDDVQRIVDFIWRYLSTVDSAGRASLMATCQSSNLELFLTGARDLAKLLTSVRKAIDSASVSLDCGRVNKIYVEAVYDGLCTEGAAAGAWGFIFFGLIAITTMTMVTLRAAWQQKVEAEKCYSEADEAEMMILDEHEEYLDYISRYKHEWQEYEGLDETIGEQHEHAPSEDSSPSVNHSPSACDDVESSIVSASSVDGAVSPVYTYAILGVQRTDAGQAASPSTIAAQDTFDPYANSASDRSESPYSTTSADISFFSLSDLQLGPGRQSPAMAGDKVFVPRLLAGCSQEEGVAAEDDRMLTPSVPPKHSSRFSLH